MASFSYGKPLRISYSIFYLLYEKNTTNDIIMLKSSLFNNEFFEFLMHKLQKPTFFAQMFVKN